MNLDKYTPAEIKNCNHIHLPKGIDRFPDNGNFISSFYVINVDKAVDVHNSLRQTYRGTIDPLYVCLNTIEDITKMLIRLPRFSSALNSRAFHIQFEP